MPLSIRRGAAMVKYRLECRGGWIGGQAGAAVGPCGYAPEHRPVPAEQSRQGSAMKYLLSVMIEHGHDVVAGGLDIEEWVTKHDASGAREFGDRLAAADQAVTVRVRGDGTHREQGPFSPAHAALAGIDLIEAATIEEALQIAAEHPMAREGAIEIRPFYDWDSEEA